jgi:hypothetical protein
MGKKVRDISVIGAGSLDTALAHFLAKVHHPRVVNSAKSEWVAVLDR